ncbi:MAG: ABC transporter substrate-binding protein [Actinomycetota bacterium]|nr:ABC transporter substrate-binding protein [Actinomycetota bacterium]
MRRVLTALCAFALIGAACSGGGGTSTTTEPAELPVATEQPPTTTTATETTTDPLATTTTEAPEPVRGGSVIVADDQEPPTLNPYAPGGDSFIVSIIGQAHLAGVSDIDATTLELIPELVVELPSVGNGGVTVNDDGTMTVRWEIREEALWSDFFPITGDDLAFTLEFREAMNQCWPDDDFRPEPFQLGGEIETIDAKTIVIRFDQPGLEYEQLFEWVVPQHAVAGSDYCEDWNDEMWPAAGPFVVDEWQQGEFLRFVRNEWYWKADDTSGEQLPYLDSVEFRFIPDAEMLVEAFRARDVDVIQPPPSPEIIGELEPLAAVGVEVQVLPGPVWEHLNFQFGPNNRNTETLNEYTAFRQAVAYAIDSEALAAAVGWLPIDSVLDPLGEAGPWAQYSPDITKAQSLLQEACDAAGHDCAADRPLLVFSTSSNSDERPRIAEKLVGMLGAVGIGVEIQLEDSQLFFGETLDNGTWDVGWWAWVLTPGATGSLAALDLFDPDAPPPDGMNFYRWGTPDSSVQDDAVDRFREVLEILRGTVDTTEIKSFAAAAEQILADNAVIIPVAARRVAGAVWADEIAGYQLNTSRSAHTWNIESWHRVDL